MKVYYLVLALLLTGSAGVNAQVTIGSTAAPHKGAILDLKSSTKGLLLPNVALNSDLTQFVLDGTAADKATAKGMLVYNTKDNQVYFWDGTKWGLVSGSGGGLGFDLPGLPGNWVLPGAGVAGAGTVSNPFTNVCPTPVVVITAQAGYTLSSPVNGTLSGSSVTFNTLGSGTVTVTKDGKRATIYTKVVACGANEGCPGYLAYGGVYTGPKTTTAGIAISVFTRSTNQNLCWYKTDQGGNVTWNGANTGCSTLADSRRDWRLPNIAELSAMQGVYNKLTTQPTSATGTANLLATNAYWSTTEYNVSSAWLWFFGNGSATSYIKSTSYYARCVRNN